MPNVFISKNYRHLRTGGDKAKTDVEDILVALGWQNIGLPQGRISNSVGAYFYTLASVCKALMRLRRGDALLLQYPLKKHYDRIVRTANRRGAKVITLIHDLGCFRRKKLGVEEEIERLNRSDVLLVHTREMAQWLRDHGITVPIIEVGLWDYRGANRSASASESLSSSAKEHPSLAYVGDLSMRHNSFLYSLSRQSDITLRLYGSGFDGEAGAAADYRGSVDAESIIDKVEGDYGLIWYGSSLETVDGPIGEYLPYCASHKTSLYMRAGLPVVIWDKAALARTVTELGIGIAVPSLVDIGPRLAAITPEEYAAMSRRARAIGNKIAAGGFLTEALATALKSLYHD